MTSSQSASGLHLITDMKIRTKILLGFFIVLGLLIAVGATGFLGLRKTSDTFDQYSTIADVAMNVMEVENNVAELRRFVVLFADTGDADRLKSARALIDEIKSDIPRVTAMFIDSGRKAKFASIGQPMNDYASQFEKVAVLRGERDSILTQTLNPSGEKAQAAMDRYFAAIMRERDLETIDRTRILDELLANVRINALRFLASPSKEQGEKTDAQFAEFARLANETQGQTRASDLKSLLSGITIVMSEYRDAFSGIAGKIQEIDGLVNGTMASAATTSANTVNEVTTAQNKRLNEMQDETRSSVGFSLTLTGVLSAGALGLGILLALVIGAAISKPVIAMTAAMAKLAGGDLNAEIPARGRGDEIGEMANAVQVFKESMTETERLRAETERLKQQAEVDKLAAMNKLADEFEASIRGVVSGVA